MIKTILHSILILSCFKCFMFGQSTKWPQIKNTKCTIELSDSGPRSVCKYIYDSNNDSKYLFEAYLSAFEFKEEFAGDFECLLSPLYRTPSFVKHRYNTLFCNEYNPARTWWHRGVFNIPELTNEHQDSIEGWGRHRVFKLRGMKIDIDVTEFELAKTNEFPYWTDANTKRLKRLKFTLTIERDESITSDIHIFPENDAANGAEAITTVKKHN